MGGADPSFDKGGPGFRSSRRGAKSTYLLDTNIYLIQESCCISSSCRMISLMLQKVVTLKCTKICKFNFYSSIAEHEKSDVKPVQDFEREWKVLPIHLKKLWRSLSNITLNSKINTFFAYLILKLVKKIFLNFLNASEYLEVFKQTCCLLEALHFNHRWFSPKF